jgi:hypothetical protein
MAQMTPNGWKQEQGWHQWMETSAGRATSTGGLNLYEYLVLLL